MDEKLLNLPDPDKIENINPYIAAWKKIRQELLNSIAIIPEDRFIQPMSDKSWSASEITEHIYATQCRFARVIPIVLKGRLGTDTVAISPETYEEIKRYFAGHRKVKNPDAVTPVKVPDKKTVIGSLNDAMSLFEKNVSGIPFAELAGKSLEHPIFGALNLPGYIWVLIMHENHHTFILRNKYGQAETPNNN